MFPFLPNAGLGAVLVAPFALLLLIGWGLYEDPVLTIKLTVGSITILFAHFPLFVLSVGIGNEKDHERMWQLLMWGIRGAAWLFAVMLFAVLPWHHIVMHEGWVIAGIGVLAVTVVTVLHLAFEGLVECLVFCAIEIATLFEPR